MDYIGAIYRPPSEARSLLLQVTVGCSHNRCSFCAMYRGKRFRPKPMEVIERDILEAVDYPARRLFLCDGDALILSTERLALILTMIRRYLPHIERVGVYGDNRSILRKSVVELKQLRELGLGIVYHGAESGNDEVLKLVEKGATRDETIAAGLRIKQAGIGYSVMVLLGLGGMSRSSQHAMDTATYLSIVNPDYVGALSLTLVPGTPLAEEQARGAFQSVDKFTFLQELRTIVKHARLDGAYLTSMHASNYLSLRIRCPQDQQAAVEMLDQVISSGDEGLLRPEFLRGL